MRATLVAATILFASCGSVVPWKNQPATNEVNLAFTLENNLLFLPSATVDGKHGRFFFGSAAPRTVLDPRTVAAIGGTKPYYTFVAGDRQSMTFAPAVLDLGEVGDAMIGSDVVGRQSVTIDYRAGLVTLQKGGIPTAYMTVFRFRDAPAVDVNIDGETISAIVDTALPGTIVLPAATRHRGRATIALAGTSFGDTEVEYADIPRARIGNRILSKFLVGIDYGRKVVGLWRDPRIR